MQTITDSNKTEDASNPRKQSRCYGHSTSPFDKTCKRYQEMCMFQYGGPLKTSFVVRKLYRMDLDILKMPQAKQNIIPKKPSNKLFKTNTTSTNLNQTKYNQKNRLMDIFEITKPHTDTQENKAKNRPACERPGRNSSLWSTSAMNRAAAVTPLRQSQRSVLTRAIRNRRAANIKTVLFFYGTTF